MSLLPVVVVLLATNFSIGRVNGLVAQDEILSLPGWHDVLPSRQFSGFVNATEDGSVKMHYWFIESEESPADAPLLLWFNGGPGASSLYGILVELGPFVLNDYSREGPEYEATSIPQLFYNPYGWQKAANLLALSMPPPVGFSYCTPPGPSASGADCGNWSDTTTASVTYHAIKSWLQAFPEYSKNEMFLSGESYAGVYVPTIVRNILANPQENINLKGFAVGDACTPPDICGSKPTGPYWMIQFLFGKTAISNSLYEQINSICSLDELTNGGLSAACAAVVDQVNVEAGGYWVYAYYDDCWYENDIRRERSRKLIHIPSLHGEADDVGQPYYGPPLTSGISGRSVSDWRLTPKSVVDFPNGYACGGPSAQVEWLGKAEVKRAINVPEDAVFFQSDNGVGFTYIFDETDLISWYKEVIANNTLRVLVYNGDTDPCINSFQAQNWTRNLGFKETQSWRAWTLDSCQRMGGYVIRYENNFDFVSIRGSGHMVPQFKPQASLEFLMRFLKGEDYQPYDASCSVPGVESVRKTRTKEEILKDMDELKGEYLKLNAQLEHEMKMIV
jgi:serine carboxypeptidase-like clade 1